MEHIALLRIQRGGLSMEANRLNIARRFFASSKMLLQGTAYAPTQFSRDKIYLPIVYLVDGKMYWFLNAAKRAAFNYRSKIESMDVHEAFMLINGRKMTAQEQSQVEWDLIQRGEDYNGFLFKDNKYIISSDYNPYE